MKELGKKGFFRLKKQRLIKAAIYLLPITSRQERRLFEVAALELTKDDWIGQYASRILQMWRQRQGPLGRVDEGYLEQLKEELEQYFDDPLKRSLIETSY